jgi:4-amino-4-deoxy-L-arabinose transferase-like glycosyltransferase
MTIETPHQPEGAPLTPWPVAVRTPARLRTEAVAAALIVLFLVVGFWYSLTVPPFETPDEVFHYAFARHLAAGNPLPVQDPSVEAPWEQEGSQAPLYYWLVGRLTAGIDQSDFPQISVRNPRANIGDPLFPGNKNFMLYSAADHPLAGANLALHVGRWFSLLLGALTLFFIYLTARLAFPTSPFLALMVLLIVATIPQFTFISAALTNDNLINAASAATVYWLARLLNAECGMRNAESAATQIPHSAFRIPHWIVLGLLLGIAALSKLQGLGLFLLSALVGLLIAWQRRDWRLPLRALLPVALPALAIAGWWYWRNDALYGDWTGIGNLLANNGRRDDPLTLAGFWREFRGLRYSFWGLFGWFNLLLPQWIYTLLDGVTLLALAGLVWPFVRRSAADRGTAHNSQFIIHNSQFTIVLLLFTWAALSLALLLYWTIQATGSQGRLLFPGIGAFVILLVMGLQTWLKRLSEASQRWIWLLLPALLLGSSVYSLTVLLPAAYQAPLPIATVPASAATIDIVYGDDDKLKLLALEIPDRRYAAGEAIPVTLYLRASAQVQDDYQLFIQFLDENRVEVGNLTSHPAWGRNPTSLWTPGAIYADSYPVLISGRIDHHAPLLAQVYVGFVDPRTEKSGRFPILARTADGAAIDPFVGQVAISPHESPAPVGLTPVGAQFGNVIQLTGFRSENLDSLMPGQPLTVTLQWDAIGIPATDYTDFVHLRDGNGATVTGFDQAPAAERFPTRYWRSGDRIVSTVALTIPADLEAGDYALWVGLYESASGGALRLPVTESAGHESGDGEVRLGLIQTMAPQ